MAEPGSKYSVNPAPPVAKTVELPVWTWSVAEEHLEIDERHGILRAKKKLEPYEDLELGKLEVKRRAAIDLAFKELSKERKEAEKLMRRFKVLTRCSARLQGAGRTNAWTCLLVRRSRP